MPRDRFIVGQPLGRWQTNCYVVGDRSTGGAFVVDPGEHGEEWVPETLDELGVTCEAILLTHGHIDHIWAVPRLADRLDCPAFLHPEDRWLWDSPMGGMGAPPEAMDQLYGGPWEPPDHRLEDLADGQKLAFAGVTLVGDHTPGHTPGHMTFRIDGAADADITLRGPRLDGSAGVVFSGDLIFAGSVGRTDFPRGDTRQLLDSIAQRVLPLEDDVLVLSGHGPETTVGQERARNPFVAEIQRRGI